MIWLLALACRTDKDVVDTGVVPEVEDADEDGVPADQDCDDADASVFPDAPEACNEVDEDCDGLVDEGVQSTFYADTDGDGYGDAAVVSEGCQAPSGFVDNDGDCDDSQDSVNPDGVEVCNDVDDDCNGTVDDDASDATAWYPDQDEDGYGDPATSQLDCDQPTGTVSDDTDCDDQDPDIHPDAAEVCDGVDNDCDTDVDEDDVLGDAQDCAADDCQDILTRRTTAADGTYWIDPAGTGAFEAWCDMTTDGGGWTLLGSFVNGDGTYRWTQYGSDPDNLSAWTDTSTFGALTEVTTADYKSEAFWTLDATDLLAVDDGGDWASYDGALSTNLTDTLLGYSSCSTGFLSGVAVDSSVANVADYGQISFFGGDPNNGYRCALNYQSNNTDSSVIALAHQGCGTAGFGHVGWWTGSSHQDNDAMFCLQDSSTLIPNTSSGSSGCAAYNGQTALYWFVPSACSYALLYAR